MDAKRYDVNETIKVRETTQTTSQVSEWLPIKDGALYEGDQLEQERENKKFS